MGIDERDGWSGREASSSSAPPAMPSTIASRDSIIEEEDKKDFQSVEHIEHVVGTDPEKGLGKSPLDLQAASANERAVVRHFDRRILPVVCILYLFAYLDRTNLGNARLQGLPQDALNGDKSGKSFDWVNSAFFFSYILVQVPATITSKYFNPKAWIACAAIGWGTCSTLMASGFNIGGLITARVGLGVFEAGFGPAIPLYLSFFYVKSELGLRVGYWFGFAAVAGAFGGLVAFGVQHIKASIADWRLLFIIEGIPTIMIGFLTFFLLPDRPGTASFLDKEQQEVARMRMDRGTSADRQRGVNKAHIKSAFKDWRIYAAGVIYFGLNNALASTSAFLPTIIKTFGATSARAQLLTVPPYAVTAVVLAMCSYASDRLQSRGIFMTVASFLGGIGYLLLLVVHINNQVRYFATFLITSGTYTTIGIIIAWFAHNLGSETKKATGIPMFMAIGQCGSVLGSHIYPLAEGPRYTKGFALSMALLFLAALLSAALSISYRLDNKRRDANYGKVNPDDPVDLSELADKTPNFRYLP